MNTSHTINSTVAATYDSLAVAYEQYVVPLYRPIAKRLLQFVDLRPGWKVLDAGTGTGLVALLGAPRVGKSGKMIGVDGSEGMLGIARRKAEQFGFTQCDFVRGDIEALEFQDSNFNACLSEFALHYTDLNKSLSELHRVLTSGGTLVLQAWANDSSAPHKSIWEILPRYQSAAADQALTDLRAQSNRSANFRRQWGTVDALRKLVSRAGFSNVDVREESHAARVMDVASFFKVMNASPLLGAEIAAMDVDTRHSFYHEATTALKRFESETGFSWPFNVLAVIAKK